MDGTPYRTTGGHKYTPVRIDHAKFTPFQTREAALFPAAPIARFPWLAL